MALVATGVETDRQLRHMLYTQPVNHTFQDVWMSPIEEEGEGEGGKNKDLNQSSWKELAPFRMGIMQEINFLIGSQQQTKSFLDTPDNYGWWNDLSQALVRWQKTKRWLKMEAQMEKSLLESWLGKLQDL